MGVARLLPLVLVANLAVATVAFADDQTSSPAKPVTAIVEANTTTNTPSSVKSEGLKGKVIITGSNIPQDVKRVGRTTDAISPVLIIDQQDIQRSGATTVGDVLKRVPFATTGPGR
jgi:outer membrane cobalamin receptor